MERLYITYLRIFFASALMLTAGLTAYAQEANPAAAARQDSASHYRPAPVYPQNPGDLNAKSSTDLGQPENISPLFVLVSVVLFARNRRYHQDHRKQKKERLFHFHKNSD